jgi:cytoskeletal protein CcmA (bactofilin family)
LSVDLINASNATIGNLTIESLNVTTNTTTGSLDVSGQTITDTLIVVNDATLGLLTVSGEIRGESLVISGNITADSLNITGGITLDDAIMDGLSVNMINASNAVIDNLTAESIDVSGTINTDTMHVMNGMTVGTLDVSGNANMDSLNVSGIISGNSLDITGSINCDAMYTSSMTVGHVSIDPSTLNVGILGIIKYVETINDIALYESTYNRNCILVVYNNGEDDINVSLTDITISNTSDIYVDGTPHDVIIEPSRSRIFIRVMFNPSIWEASDQFINTP